MKILTVLMSLLITTQAVYANTLSPQTDVSGLNNFAINLYQQASNENIDKNMAISPFGITSVLNIIYSGTAGNTKQEIGKVLGLAGQNNNQYYINSLTKSFGRPAVCTDHFYCSWANRLLSSYTSQFINGNALWLQSGIVLNDKFAQQFKQADFGKYYYVDFINNPAAAVDQINSWVVNLSNGYLTQLITPALISDQTRIIVTNAIYFKGLWQHAFDASLTQPSNFTLDNGHLVTIPTMSVTHSFNYAENATTKVLIMPYKDSSLALAILLPKQADDFNQFVKSLTSDMITKLILSANSTEIDAAIPKFIIQSTFNNMQNNLVNLGIKQVFTNHADFSPMTTTMQLKLSKVIQKIYIAVDEKGTVAAAATAAVMVFGSAAPMEFSVDHPFVFLIYDTNTNLILFVGNVMDPSQQ